MSKITKALEKAAQERLQHRQEQPTVTAGPTVIPVAAPASADNVPCIDHIRIDPHIVSATAPSSPIAEQYRILRTNLQALDKSPGAKVLVVTSAIHEEGKSVTAINLAIALAQQEHHRVLLVDADLRRSAVHRWLGIDSEQGLSTVLSNGLSVGGALVRLQTPPLSVLPAGPKPAFPAELLESSRMKRLIGILKSQFSLILIDAPPLLPVADPGILGMQADGVIMVIRAGKTQRKTVLQAKDLLKQSRAKLMGCILTHVDYYVPGYSRYYDMPTNGHGEPSYGTLQLAHNY